MNPILQSIFDIEGSQYGYTTIAGAHRTFERIKRKVPTDRKAQGLEPTEICCENHRCVQHVLLNAFLGM